MTEEKRNRIIAAVTVNVILLIAILAAVVIYQIIKIQIVKRNRDDIVNQIKYYQTETDKNEKTLEYYKSYEGLIDKAYEFGYVFGK
ncbi:MAG: hypothetical protein K2N23_08115 [Clostridia bacterium]|nr:hypothetical protein [Clostridia bacterium]